MKKLLLGVIGLVIVLVAAVVALPFVLPRAMIKAQVEERVSAELGRPFVIAGPLTLRPWRPFALTLEDVRLANPDWAATPDLARIARLELDVDALAYLGGAVVVERLIVEQPALALEVREDGTPSWVFNGAGREPADGTADATADDGEREALPEIRIGEIRIVDGSITLDDRSTGMDRSFTGLELRASSAPGSSALDVDASVTSSGETATLTAAIGDLNRLLRGEASSLALDMAAPGLGIAADGEASPAGNAVLAVSAELAPPVLLDWLGQPTDAAAVPVAAIDLSLDLAATPTGIALHALELSADDLIITGDLALAFADRPKLSGSLDLGALDLRPFLEPTGTSGDAEPPADAAGAEGSQGWPETPLDVPLPLPLDIDLTLQLASLVTHELTLGSGSGRIVADASQTSASIDALELYDGQLTSRATVRNAGTLDVDIELEASGVQLEPLLADLAQVDQLAGNGNVQIAVTSEGSSVAALMRALDGQGTILARDGAINGINIGATIRQVMTLGVQNAAAEPQRTDFAEAGGTFTIQDGVLENQDFALRAPVLRVAGAGTVNLAEQTLAYRLMPRLAATLEGQDAADEAAFQAGLPLVIEGPWSDPAVRLDLGGTLSGDIADPAALAQTVQGLASDPAMLENLRETFGIDPGSSLGGALEGLGGLLGGNAAPGDGEAGAPPADAAGRVLEGLGGLLDGNTEPGDGEAGAPPADPAGRVLEGLGGLLGR